MLHRSHDERHVARTHIASYSTQWMITNDQWCRTRPRMAGSINSIGRNCCLPRLIFLRCSFLSFARINRWSLFSVSPLRHKWIRNCISSIFRMRTLRMHCVTDQIRWSSLIIMLENRKSHLLLQCRAADTDWTHTQWQRATIVANTNGLIMNTNEISTNKMRSEKFPINGFNNLFITLNYIASIGARCSRRRPSPLSVLTHDFHVVISILYFIFTLSTFCVRFRDALLSDYNRNGCECVPGHLCTSSFMLVDENKKQIHGMFGERDGSQNI